MFLRLTVEELMTEELAIVDGYRSYFSYSRARAGYSGTLTKPWL